MTFDEVAEAFQHRYGRGQFHASAWYRALYRSCQAGVSELPAFVHDPDLAGRVERDFSITLPRIVKKIEQGGVTKLILGLFDGLEIESVMIPMPRHATLCLSSQVGCRMGCRFCQTGRMGLKRQLSADEIVAQVYLARVVLGVPVRNVVFMGMGEALDNWAPVMQAIRVLTDQRGLDIALRRMTLSTIGRVPDLERLASMGSSGVGLAISLNAPDDDLRRHLMPATRAHTLNELKNVLMTYPLAKGGVFFIAYVLIRDVNDSADHARRTAAFLQGLPVKVNLIPFNPGEDSPFRAPEAERVEQFRRILVDARLFVRLRGAKGDAIQAACGQLGRSGQVEG